MGGALCVDRCGVMEMGGLGWWGGHFNTTATANLDSKAFAAVLRSPRRDYNDPDYYHNNC